MTELRNKSNGQHNSAKCIQKVMHKSISINKSVNTPQTKQQQHRTEAVAMRI